MTPVLSSQRKNDNLKGFLKPKKRQNKAIGQTVNSTDTNPLVQGNVWKIFSKSKNKLKVQENPSIKILEKAKEIVNLPNATETAVNHELCHFNIESLYQETENDKFLKDFYDLEERSQYFSVCLYIPSPPIVQHHTFSEQGASMDNLLLNYCDISSLGDKIETLSLMDSRNGRCACGNVNNANCNDMDRSFPLPNNSTISNPRCESGRELKSSPSCATKDRSIFSHRGLKTLSNIKDESGNTKSYKNEAPVSNQEFIFDGECDMWTSGTEDNEIQSKYFSDTVEKDGCLLDNEQISESCLKSPEIRRSTIPNNVDPQHSQVVVQYSEKDIGNGSPGELNKAMEVRYTRNKLLEMFKDDEILFEEEGDYTESDNSSTTSNDVFMSPIIKRMMKPEDIGLNSPVIIAETSVSSHFDVDNKSQSEEILFEEDLTEKENTEMILFECIPSKQSTPKKFLRKEDLSGVDSVDDEDMFPCSPDLSQYRIENRIKRGKLDSECLLGSYARMTAPDNNSADILNRFVEEMRQKSSNSQLVFDDKSDCSDIISIPCTPEYSENRYTSAYKLNETCTNSADSNKSKKKFVFKKRPKWAGISPVILNQAKQHKTPSTSVPIHGLSTNCLRKNLETFSHLNTDLSHKLDYSGTANGKEEYSSDEINSMHDVRAYQKQYCSEDIDDISDSESEFRQRPMYTKERTRNSDITEQTSFKALQSRSSIKKRKEKDLHLKELRSTNFEMSHLNAHIYSKSKIVSSGPNSLRLNRQKRTNLENLPNLGARKVDCTTSESKFNGFNAPVSMSISVSSDDDNEPQLTQFLKENSSMKTTALAEDFDDCTLLRTVPKTKCRRRKAKAKNPFLQSEARVSAGGSDENEDGVDEPGDSDDSFITQRMDDTLTSSQEAIYLASVKDVLPIAYGQQKTPPSPDVMEEIQIFDFNEDYEGDSFCVENDEVEFSEVGDLTQEMQKAKADLTEDYDDDTKRVTRNGRRHKNKNVGENCKIKRRRRVFMLTDSSEED